MACRTKKNYPRAENKTTKRTATSLSLIGDYASSSSEDEQERNSSMKVTPAKEGTPSRKRRIGYFLNKGSCRHGASCKYIHDNGKRRRVEARAAKTSTEWRGNGRPTLLRQLLNARLLRSIPSYFSVLNFIRSSKSDAALVLISIIHKNTLP